MITSNIGNNL